MKTASKKKLMIIVSTNKGLCGGFNFNLFRMISREINFSETEFVTVGKKGSFFVSKMGAKVVADYSQGSFETEVSAIFNYILAGFVKGEYKEICLVYNQFISALKQEPVIEKLLPFQVKLEQIKEKTEEYLVEPSAIEVVDALLRSYLEQRIRYAFIQSEAGEHSARMIAMKNATDNADELTYSLTMLRNKLRQQKITYELLDMVTAKESVEN
jgi:F-type H+-transporting ATPase subunit gamma